MNDNQNRLNQSGANSTSTVNSGVSQSSSTEILDGVNSTGSVQSVSNPQGNVSPQNVVSNPSIQSSSANLSQQQVSSSHVGSIPNQQVVVSSVSQEVGKQNPPTNSFSNSRDSMNEVNIQNKPPGKIRYILLIFFFIVLFALVYFLPDISSYVALFNAKKNASQDIITTGSLKCTNSRSTDRFDLSYNLLFTFSDSQLNTLTYTSVTKGDRNLDNVELNELNTKCENLTDITKSLSGVSVSCDFYNGELTENQKFVYADIDEDEVSSAYIEAGGLYPEFENLQNIDSIEKMMKAQGYSCERNR